MKKYFTIISIILIITLFYWAYRSINSTYISLEFDELRPFHNSLPIYYKGIIIGRTKGIKHSDDYQHTIVKIQLFGRHHKLPNDSVAYLKKEVRGKKHIDYIEIKQSELPKNEYIKNGTVLKGKSTFDLEEFMRNQEPESIENIKGNIEQASENLNTSLESLSELFALAQEIISENRVNIKRTVHNFEMSSQNISNSTNKINEVISEEQLSETITNIQKTTRNISDTGIVGVNEMIAKTNCILDDTNCITKGVRDTMSKPFSGLRLMFGRVITKCD